MLCPAGIFKIFTALWLDYNNRSTIINRSRWPSSLPSICQFFPPEIEQNNWYIAINDGKGQNRDRKMEKGNIWERILHARKTWKYFIFWIAICISFYSNQIEIIHVDSCTAHRPSVQHHSIHVGQLQLTHKVKIIDFQYYFVFNQQFFYSGCVLTKQTKAHVHTWTGRTEYGQRKEKHF